MPKKIPVDDCVIVKLEKVSDKSEGGIYLSEEMADRNQMNITEGILESVGPFAYHDLKVNDYDYPKVGVKVYFKRHSGILNTNEEGEVRRFIHDQDIYTYDEPEGQKIVFQEGEKNG